MRKYVIVGNGVAGVTAAQGIIQADPTADVHILSAEAHLYYRRPMLWQFISGDIEEAELYFKPAEWYQERNIRIHLGAAVTALDPQNHTLTLTDGSQMTYDRLLLTTGGDPLVLPIKGAERKDVFTLRTVEDAQAIKARATQVKSAVVIGGGLLGLETARSILRPDMAVWVLEVMPHLLPRQLCAEAAGVLQNQLQKMGLGIVTSATTEEILGDGQISGVRLKDGRVIEGEMVIISAGMRPRVELARRAQLAVNRGILVDEHMRTSAPDIYAAGDAAEFNGLVYGIVPASIEQARVAAANMVREGNLAYKGTVLSTTLKVAGIDLTCLGNSTAVAGNGLTVLTHKDEAAGQFKKLVLQENKLTGAILLGDTKDGRTVQQLIERGIDVSACRDRLLAADFDLKALLRG